MTVLSLGVIDIPYTDGKATTTGDVAEILEGKYHVIRTFLELNESAIGDELGKAMLERMGTPAFGKSDMPISAINVMFRRFLDADTMSAILPPSQQSMAAAKGVNHRKKHPYAKANKQRPAFVDTGLYQASFTAVVKF